MMQMAINQAINKIINTHPEARQLYDVLRHKSPAELKEYAENVARGKNTTLSEFLNKQGILPSNFN